MKIWLGVILVSLFLTSGCTQIGISANNSIDALMDVELGGLQTPSLTATITTTPTITATSTITTTPFLPNTATPTSTPSITPDPDKSQFGPGPVLFPILMYHHVVPYNGSGSQYAVTVDQFSRQMKWLKEQGFQTIKVADMVEAIHEGKLLPNKPVIITFDDGFRDVYDNAYPILEELGYTATMYLIEGVINKNPYVNDENIDDLIDAGWEFGNHSRTHAYLPGLSNLDDEVCASRQRLIERFDLAFDSFAYPFAAKHEGSMQAVKDCGYTSGAGNGSFTIHIEDRLFFFSRREIKSYFDMQRFITTVTDVR
ncbi:MAG: polysaccharide deacetylase family protein [Anaerolineaceae bacterium]|nr:polysaccharide deacetylase family protein [Anaerolineaceae bacterium]